jgi:hypothetical protein
MTLKAVRIACFAAAVTLSGAVSAQTARTAPAQTTQIEGDIASASRFANLALTCLHQEYPNHLSLSLTSEGDAQPPHALTPAFYGCLDWHSDVHGHWLLVRLLKQYPDAPFAQAARDEIGRSITPQNIAAEVAFMRQDGRASFERPYGLAWLLKLSAELRTWDDLQGEHWALTLQPLEEEVARRLKLWIPKLHYPIRIGEHNQTAFSFGQIWDWATVARDDEMRDILKDAAGRFYLKDKACPINYEPNGEDFLSPCLAEADFVRRTMDNATFAAWLTQFLPGIPQKPGKVWLEPAVVTDRADPKLAHLDGLNLSRAWMLQGIAHGLPANDKRVPILLAAAKQHEDAAIPNVTGEHYEGGHWLGTFAVYLQSQAGLK